MTSGMSWSFDFVPDGGCERPNFVVDGVAAHAEDDWLEVQLGEVRRSATMMCQPKPRHYTFITI